LTSTAAAGLIVVTFDHRSHGLSGLVDGLPGYANSFSDFVSDTLAVLHFATEQHPGLPYFLFGESMGGAAACGLGPAAFELRCGGVLVQSIVTGCQCTGTNA
jgi:alpha-beta hydrolase superfamily lysophospholipase